MAKEDVHVKVVITQDSVSISRAGFGTMALLTNDVPTGTFSTRVKSYADMTEVEGNFASSTDTWKALNKHFSQSVTPEKVKVIKRNTAEAQAQELVFDAALITGNTVNGIVNGVAITAVPFATSNAQTLTNLAAQIATKEGVASATSDGTSKIRVVASSEWSLSLSSFEVTGGASQALVTVNATIERVLLTFSAVLITSNVVNGKINGTSISPITFATSNAQTLTNLAAEIALNPAVASATSNGTDQIYVVGVANSDLEFTLFAVTLGASQATISVTETVEPGRTAANDLSDALAEDSDFYALTCTSTNKGLQLTVAERMSSVDKKVTVLRTTEAASYSTTSTTDLLYRLKALGYKTVMAFYHSVATDFIDSAFCGRFLPQKPGKINPAYKNLVGVTVDNLSSAVRDAVIAKNGNVYYEVLGVGVTWKGLMSGGGYLDRVRDTDYVGSQVTEDIFALFVSEDNIGFDGDGIGKISATMRATMIRLTNEGVITDDPAYTISLPDPNTQVTTQDRTDKNLRMVSATCRLVGGISSVVPVDILVAV